MAKVWMPLFIALILVLVLSLSAQPTLKPVQAEEDLEVSGTFEAVQVRVMAEVSGEVEAVLVREGDQVQEGQVLVRLDPGTLPEQLQEAEAALEAARAHLADVLAQPLPGPVQVASALVEQARARVKGAEAQVQAARAVLANPLEIEGQIRQAEAQLSVLYQELDAAQAQKKAAEVERDRYRSDLSDEGKSQYAIGQKYVDAAEAQIQAVQAKIAGTQKLIATLKAIRAQPLVLIAQVHQAEGQLRLAQAQLEVALAELRLVRSGARPEEVAEAEAQVAQAQATLDLLRAQAERYTVVAPASGSVVERLVEPGEVVQVGTPLVVVADLRQLDLVVYVPTADLGRVALGQTVGVRVDTYPERVFEGRVIWIADEAEFTPRGTQTKEDRVQTVFRVKIRVPNPDGALKAGMPADARLRY